MQRRMVVKVCDTSDELKLEAAKREWAILRKLECNLINQAIGFYEDPQISKAYLVLEWAGDRSLTTFVEDLKRSRGQLAELSDDDEDEEQPLLSEFLVKSIMKQLCQAAEFMHRHNICHRDLKPDNVMVTKYRPQHGTPNDSTAVGGLFDPIAITVIDLNVAFEVTPENPRIRYGTGLKEWSAPETRGQQFTDFNIDTWTIGCVMYFICTGQPPFRENAPIDVSQIDFVQALLAYSNSETFPEMTNFLMGLIVADPMDRMTAAEALAHPWLNAQPYE